MCIKDISLIRDLESQVLILKKSLNSAHGLLLNTRDALASMDDNLYIKVYNQSFHDLCLHLFAVSVQIGMNLDQIFYNHPNSNIKIKDACREAMITNHSSIILEHKDINHPQYYCLNALFKLYYNIFSQKNELIVSIQNMTEPRLDKKQLLKYQSDTAISSITTGMHDIAIAFSHEVNQPLTAVSLYAQSCLLIAKQELNTSDLSGKMLTYLEQIVLQSNFAGKIIQNMRDVVILENFYLEDMTINNLIIDVISLLKHELLDTNITLTVNLDDKIPVIMSNKTYLMQVVLNLARNSIEALKVSSTILPTLEIKTCTENGCISIQMIDNGPGVPLAYHNKIFDDRYTTKSQGTGIGLSICRILMAALNGHLILNNSKDQGACFTLTLPLSVHNLHK